MQIHKKTIAKIKQILSMGEVFINRYSDKGNVAIVFIIYAFEEKFKEINESLEKNDFNVSEFHDAIYEFDTVMSSWSQNLSYNIDSGNTYSNSIYDVLFSVLQGIDKLIEEDHFAWEDEPTDIPIGNYNDEFDDLETSSTDEIELLYERCIPD